jgi:nucleoid-associated protein YgaU
MGNFEKLSVLVIVVIIVMILVVALYTWTDSPGDTATASATSSATDPITPPEDPIRITEPPPVPPWPLHGDPNPPLITPGPAPADPKPSVTPPADPKPAEEPAVAERFHIVKQGETLGQIAQNELGTASRWQEIVKLNPGVEPERLRPGMKLKLPAAGPAKPGSGTPALAKDTGDGTAKPGSTYKVRRGETLQTIAKKVYGKQSRWPEIWVANLAQLDSPDDLAPDMVITLPR